MYICDKCGAHIDSEAKFCGQCGDPVTEADIPKQALSSSAIPLAVISFGYSSSANYPKSVKLCEHIPTYEVTGEGKQAVHKVTLEVTEIALIKNLYDLVGSWKSSQMLIAGKQCTKKDLTYYGLGCYQSRQQSNNPKQFCKENTDWHTNIWGCVRMPNLNVESWAYNHSPYGQLNNKGQWVLDKEKLYQDLMDSIKSHELCPKLNREDFIDIYHQLPDYIDPKLDSRWEHVVQHKYFPESERFADVITGIQPTNKHLSIIMALSNTAKEKTPQKHRVTKAEKLAFEKRQSEQHTQLDKNTYYQTPPEQIERLAQQHPISPTATPPEPLPLRKKPHILIRLIKWIAMIFFGFIALSLIIVLST